MTIQSLDQLRSKKCVPCEGGVPKLTPAEAEAQLAKLTGWSVTSDGQRIRKTWVVKKFMAAIQFFNDVAKIAESEGHHPDLHLVGYRNVAIEIWTHAIGGLSENDFILAAKIDQLTIETQPPGKQKQHYSDKLEYEIDSWDLKVAIELGEKITIIDMRSPEAFAFGHIPNAINIPHRTITSEAVAHVDKASLVVSYCDGIGCNASTKGALKMLDLGFRVKELIGGIDWWKRDGHPTSTDSSCDATNGNCGCEVG